MARNAEATVTLSLIDKISGPIRRIASRLGDLGKRAGFDRIGASIGNVGRSLAGLADGMARTSIRATALLGLIGASGGGLVAALYGLSKGTASAAKEIGNLSQVAGLHPIDFQRWSYAASTVGISAEKMADILKDVGDKMGDYFQNGSGEAKDFFENIGPKVGKSAKQLAKEFKGLSSGDALKLYVKYLQKANLSQSEMTFYMEAIANDATLLLPLLRNNGAELERLGKLAGIAGVIFGETAIALGKKFTENLQGLEARLEGLRNLLGIRLLPVFDEFVVKLTELYDANVALIRVKIDDWAETIGQFLRDLLDPTSELRQNFRDMIDTISSGYEAVKPFIDYLGGPFKSTLWLLAAWVAGPMVAALATLGAAFIQLGIVILSTPVGWFLGAMAIIGAAVYVLYQRWDEFVSYFADAWSRVKAAFNENFLLGIGQALEEFNPVLLVMKGINAVIEYFTGINLQEYGTRMIRTLLDGIASSQFATVIVDTVSGWWSAYENWWDSFSASVRAAGAAIVDAIWDGLKERWGMVVDWLRSSIRDLISWLPESIQTKLGFSATGEPVKNPGEAIGSSLKPNTSVPAVPSVKAPVPAPIVIPQSQVPRLSPVAADLGFGDTKIPAFRSPVPAAPAPSGGAAETTVTIPENMIVHEPKQTNVDAKTSVTVNITGLRTDDTAAIAAAVRGAMAERDRKQAAAITSALSD